MYLVVPPGGLFPEMRRIELGPTTLTIGRAETCEIHVDFPGVDAEHAKISEVALIALGPDCAIGDVPLDAGSRRLVMPGDEIQIGSIVLALEGHDPSIVPPPPDGQSTQRMGAVGLDGPRVRVVEGPNFGDELLLKEEGREYVVGRGTKNDLVIDDREVSREHIKLMRRGYAVFVKDLGSTRGSWLGRSAVYSGATVEWQRPRMLRLGATVLSLELPEAVRRAVPGAQPSAPMTPPPRSRRGGPQSTPSPPGVGLDLAMHGSAQAPSPSQRPPRVNVAIAAVETSKLGNFDHGALPAAAHAAGAEIPAVVSVSMGSSLGSLPPPPMHPRKAWKKSGPTIGKVTGLLLLALAGLVILGGIFVVFSLLE